jgi:hypothetical protein
VLASKGKISEVRQFFEHMLVDRDSAGSQSWLAQNPNKVIRSLHQNALEDMPVHVMPEFVCKNRLDLFGRVVIKKSVGQDDAARIAQSGESSIRFLALLGKLPAIYTPDSRSGVFAQQLNQAPP